MLDLLDRARSLSGMTLPELARAAAMPMPDDLGRHKGFVGRAVESALGLEVRTAPGPDLPGLELKTLPVALRDGLPRSVESTFVCTVPRDGLEGPWEGSAPHAKLARVLFVPVEASGAAAARRIGTPFLWSPSHEDEARLQADWDLLTGELALRGHERISARLGLVLQVRPKARDARSRGLGRDDSGALSRTLPRGFYLRRAFTTELLQRSGLC
jgi:DNA mismatch repair protein MutH